MGLRRQLLLPVIVSCSFCFLPPLSGQGTWATVAPMPTASESFGLASAPDGRIYAIGGDLYLGYYTPSNILQIYTPTTNSWAAGASMPTPRYGLAAAVANGAAYAIGGYNGGPLSVVEAYNLTTRSWSSVARMPTARFALGAVTGCDGRIYAIGGDTSGGGANSNVVEIYDPSSGKWSEGTPMPQPRINPAVSVGNDCLIYVMGGESNGSTLSSVIAYNPATGLWASKKPMPTARGAAASAVAADGTIYVIGGVTSTDVTNVVEAYTPSTDTWVSETPVPTARGGLKATFAPDGRLYAIGGFIFSSPGQIALNVVEAFTPPAAATPTISPNTGLNTSTVRVTIAGSQISTGAQVKLTGTGVPDILANSILYPSPSVLSAWFDLSGAPAGPRNVLITEGTSSINIPGGFTVVGLASCTYSIAPSPQSMPGSGGTGDVVVSGSPAQCPWTAIPNENWISVVQPLVCGPPAGCSTPAFSFSVAANTSASPRSGTVSVVNDGVTRATFTINQAGSGAPACNYTLSPLTNVFAQSGGSTTVEVTAPAGCSWSTSNAPSWISVQSGSGSGNGSVVLTALPNSGGPRSGALTIAGRTFGVSQAATACGATDVSDKIIVSQSTPRLVSVINSLYARDITLTNTSNQFVAGPIYLVTDGLPNYTALGCQNGCGLIASTAITHCLSPNPLGSYLIEFSISGLAPGQSVKGTPTFIGGNYGVLIGYTTRVFSGTPNQ